MGEGFHLFHGSLVGMGGGSCTPSRDINWRRGGVVGWSFRRSFALLLDSQVVLCTGRAWCVTCVCAQNSSPADEAVCRRAQPGPPAPGPLLQSRQGRGGEPAEAPGDC